MSNDTITLPLAVVKEALQILWKRYMAEDWPALSRFDDAVIEALAQPMTDGEYKKIGEQIKAQPQVEPDKPNYRAECWPESPHNTPTGKKSLQVEAHPATQPLPPVDYEKGWQQGWNSCMASLKPATQPDADEFSGPMLVEWLKNKYKRHHELEDLKAAELLESLLKAQPATQPTPAPAGEPVAWAHKEGLDSIKEFDASIYAKGGFDDAIPLYTTPPPRKPLTLERIDAMYEEIQSKHALDGRWLYELTKAIEKAHGITGGQDD